MPGHVALARLLAADAAPSNAVCLPCCRAVFVLLPCCVCLVVFAQTAALTPNFNRLTAEGAMVANAFSYIPLCVPSRAALLTGTPPEITQVWRGTDEDVDPRVPTAAAVMQENGYWTEFYGTHARVLHVHS